MSKRKRRKMFRHSKFKRARTKHRSPPGTLIIFTRSEEEARRVYKRFFNKSLNEHQGCIRKGHLHLRYTHNFSVPKFWASCGYYPVLIGKEFFNHRLYQKIIPTSIQFLQSIVEE